MINGTDLNSWAKTSFPNFSQSSFATKKYIREKTKFETSAVNSMLYVEVIALYKYKLAYGKAQDKIN